MSSVLAILVAALMVGSCSTRTFKESKTSERDEAYDTEFPSRPDSKELQSISQSVCTITCIGSYKVFPFDDTERVVRSDVNDLLLQRKSASAYFSDNSVRGTATVITNDGTRIGFLTCAHVVEFPDTAIEFRTEPDGRATKYIRSVDVKMKQFNFISPFPEDGSVEIITLDREKDLAVVGKMLQTELGRGFPPIHYSLGHADELGWGTFVYVFSYPAGIKMVTSAIVSSPRKDAAGTFYIDGVLSPGTSGGIVLALRNGVPNFEIVGIVRVVPARITYFLAPGDSVAKEYDEHAPYTGSAFVRKRTDLETGVTKCIPAEVVRSFLEQHKEQMAKVGYDCSDFLKSKGN